MNKLHKNRQITLYGGTKGLFLIYIGTEVIPFNTLERFNHIKNCLQEDNLLYIASLSQVKDKRMTTYTFNQLEEAKVEGFSYFGNALNINRIAEEIEITEYWVEDTSYSSTNRFTPVSIKKLEGVFFVGSYSVFLENKKIIFGKPDWMDLQLAIKIASIILDNSFSDIYFIGEKGKQQFKEEFIND
jgi:hypothetical protein